MDDLLQDAVGGAADDAPVVEPPNVFECCSAGIVQAAKDIERQTMAFNYCRDTWIKLSNLDPDDPRKPDLPFLSFHIPGPNGQPGIYQLDLNTANPELLEACIPLFAQAASHTSGLLIQSWKAVFNLVGIVEPIVTTADKQRKLATSRDDQ